MGIKMIMSEHGLLIRDTTTGKTYRGDGTIVNDSPVRTVTRREIVPGTYGRIVVDGASNGTVKLTFKYKTIPPEFTAEELDSAAMVFSQLAEALRDG